MQFDNLYNQLKEEERADRVKLITKKREQKRVTPSPFPPSSPSLEKTPDRKKQKKVICHA
jgi:hypothetical protein